MERASGFAELGINPTLDTAWWWYALAEGTLLMPACRAHGHRFFPPQAFCPVCGSAEVYGAPANGRGAIYSWVVIHRAFGPNSGPLPYGIVAVDMADGGRLIGRFVGEPATIANAAPVAATIVSHDGAPILGFALTAEA